MVPPHSMSAVRAKESLISSRKRKRKGVVNFLFSCFIASQTISVLKFDENKITVSPLSEVVTQKESSFYS